MGNRIRKRSARQSSIIPTESIEHKILLIRGEKVIIDADLAALYGVETRRLNEQVIRNLDRFPDDFMFQLTRQELRALISQFAISNGGRGGRTKCPYAFTEHGAIMAASVLNTPRAVEMSVFVVRAFVRLRAFLATHKELAEKLAELERKLESHDEQIVAIIDAIKRLMAPPARPDAPALPDKRRIGFRSKNGGPTK
ncbi:MAG: ORF6N domain-containing protein [Candidatus Krumholzibacteria bacterium]|nr:ORF6N domain-containing protein [Candidatus Krumholzibacteria bacterium]